MWKLTGIKRAVSNPCCFPRASVAAMGMFSWGMRSPPFFLQTDREGLSSSGWVRKTVRGGGFLVRYEVREVEKGLSVRLVYPGRVIGVSPVRCQSALDVDVVRIS